MVTGQRKRKLILNLLLGAVVVFTATGCSSHQPSLVNKTSSQKLLTTSNTSTNNNNFVLRKSQDDFAKMLGSAEVKSRLLDQYSDWKGVRYRLGGSTKKGIDCSGFVQRTFRDQFGLELPRTSLAMGGAGQSIAMNELQVGDLVLFKINARTGHVGIYLGNNKFVHASTTSGVMISRLDETYWSKRYRQARRVLDNMPYNNLNLARSR